MTILLADWTKYGTKKTLEANIGNGFKVRLGWTERATETIYCEDVPPSEKKGANQNLPHYQVYAWIRIGIRAEIAALLAAPVHTENQ